MFDLPRPILYGFALAAVALLTGVAVSALTWFGVLASFPLVVAGVAFGALVLLAAVVVLVAGMR
ncbi:MAG: hypothetical protein ACTH0V_00560 [Microbacteriaceae bacterium]